MCEVLESSTSGANFFLTGTVPLTGTMPCICDTFSFDFVFGGSGVGGKGELASRVLKLGLDSGGGGKSFESMLKLIALLLLFWGILYSSKLSLFLNKTSALDSINLIKSSHDARTFIFKNRISATINY